MKITDKRMMDVVLQASITCNVNLKTQDGIRVQLSAKDATNSLVRSNSGNSYDFTGRNVVRPKEDGMAIVAVCTENWMPMTQIQYADDLLWFVATHGKSHLEVETVRGWRKLTESEPLLPVRYRVGASFLKTMDADFLYTVAAILKTTEKQLRAVSVADGVIGSEVSEININSLVSEDGLRLRLCKDIEGKQYVILDDAPFAIYGE